MPKVLALIKRHGAGSQRSARARVWILWRAQTSPANPAGKTKAIKPFGIVVGNASSEDRRFPCGQRQLASIELLQNRLQTFSAFDAMSPISALPGEEKPIKILR